MCLSLLGTWYLVWLLSKVMKRAAITMVMQRIVMFSQFSKLNGKSNAVGGFAVRESNANLSVYTERINTELRISGFVFPYLLPTYLTSTKPVAKACFRLILLFTKKYNLWVRNLQSNSVWLNWLLLRLDYQPVKSKFIK